MMQTECMKKNKTHHEGGNECDGHWQHPVHIVFAGLDQRWRQVAAQFVQTIRDLFLKQ